MTGEIAEKQDLLATLELLEDHVASEEPGILALMPEEDRFDRLRRDAEALLERYPRLEQRPPLFGVPIGVKDIFHVDGLPTTAGSRLPPDELAGAEAASVTTLTDAGALVIGKTVSTEFAFFAPGTTRNPHDPERTPGGSSSGSAAAVAAGYCPLALGTQTIGSISRPASFCGVVGYKPTYERISREGVIPLSPSLDHVGLLAIDVDTAALAASLLCHDWQPEKGDRLPVLGVPKGPYLERAEAEGLEHFRSACHRLTDAGYSVKTVEVLADFDEIVDRHYSIVAAEASQIHTDWYARYGDRYHQKTRELIERGQKVTTDELEQALPGRQRLRDELTTLMREEGIDLWISPPAAGPAPKGLDSTGDPIMNLPWTHAGLPTVTLPAGTTATGLPMGLQIAAGRHQDELLLTWATALEVIGSSTTN